MKEIDDLQAVMLDYIGDLEAAVALAIADSHDRGYEAGLADGYDEGQLEAQDANN